MGSALGVAKTAAKKIGCTAEEWLAKRAAGERWCSRCREWSVIENIAPDRRRPDGIGIYCRACTAESWASRRMSTVGGSA